MESEPDPNHWTYIYWAGNRCAAFIQFTRNDICQADVGIVKAIAIAVMTRTRGSVSVFKPVMAT